jgi:hypothetical protein
MEVKNLKKIEIVEKHYFYEMEKNVNKIIFWFQHSWGMAWKISQFGYENERRHLKDADEIIIEKEEISILYSYPLSVTAKLTFTSRGVFRRIDVARCIYEGYRKIYEEEEQEDKDPGYIQNTYNRGFSKGRYGIWGHYLEDLILSKIEYLPKHNIVLPRVES